MARPILVTGSHRSGTTWVGRMLSLPKEVVYLHEPFNPNRAPGWLARPLPYWFLYVCGDNEHDYAPAVRDMLALRYRLLKNISHTRSPKAWARQLRDATSAIGRGRKGHRPLVKDPMALFSAPWLAARFDMQVVVMIRHPAAFVGSIKKLNWGFDYEVNWLGQDLLMRDLLSEFDDDFRDYVGEVDLIHEGIVMWNAFHHVIERFRTAHPNWTFVKYEDLADDPEDGFRLLYERLELEWNEGVATQIRDYASSANPKDVPTWKRRAVKRDSRAAKTTWTQRLSPEEIARIKRETARIAAPFYGDEEWEVGLPRAPENSSAVTPP